MFQRAPGAVREGTVLTLGANRILWKGSAIGLWREGFDALARVTEKLDRLRGHCRGKRGASHSCNLILKVDRDFEVRHLRRYLRVVRRVGFGTVDFLFRKSNGNWWYPAAKYSTVTVHLLGGPATSPYGLGMCQDGIPGCSGS